MIIQNSTDIKTEYFLDKNNDISPVDVQYEKHVINPNGLVQLQKIPTVYTVFNITGKDGIKTIQYNKADIIINQTDFIVDYQNGILTFHSSQINKSIQASYTNAIGRLDMSADRIFTNIDNQGKIIEVLGKTMDENRKTLESIKVLGDAVTVIEQTQANIESIKGLTGSIAEGTNIKTELDKSNEKAKSTNNALTVNTNNAIAKIQEMNEWVDNHENIVDLDNRVKTTESELINVNSQLAEKALQSDLGNKSNLPTNDKTSFEKAVIEIFNSLTSKLSKTQIKESIGFADINKNMSKIDQTMLTDNLLKAISGTANIYATIADKSVTKEKMGFLTLEAIPSKNLFDKTKVTNGYYISPASGNLLVNALYCASDYIEITASQYVLNEKDQGAFYDENKIYVSGFSNTALLTRPANAKYIRFSTPIKDVNTRQFEEGNIITEYESASPKMPNDALSESLYSALVNESVNNSISYFNKNVFKGYLRGVSEHLNNPFVKTTIKLVGDSITAGVGGTGYSATGTPIGSSGFKSNVLTAVCWANMLYDIVNKKFNKEIYIPMNNPNLKYTNDYIFGLTRDGLTRLKTYVTFTNSKVGKGIEFTMYGDEFSIEYTGHPASGILDIYVDGNKIGSLDAYNTSVSNKQSFDVVGLGIGKHEVKILETATKNVSSSGVSVIIEAIKLFKIATVKNYGISGVTTTALESLKETLFESEDDFTFIQLGTNDRSFFNHVESSKSYIINAINYIQANSKSKVILMSANPVSIANDSNVLMNFKMDDVDLMVNDVSSMFGLPYISNYDAFLRYEQATGVAIDSLLADGLHPNDVGYKVMFENICRQIGLPILRSGLVY